MAELSPEEKKRIIQQLRDPVRQLDQDLSCLKTDTDAYKDKLDNLPQYIEEIDLEFEKNTGLNKVDACFVMLACVLQAGRIVLVRHYKDRLSDKESAQNTPGHGEEHSSRRTAKYYASIDEIKENPVPFDCVQKEEVVKRNGNPKLSGMNHRYKAIGHDPYLGLIFGTANIITNTITVAEGAFKFSTYHVHTGTSFNGGNIDKICAGASTPLMFEKIGQRLHNEKKEGYKALGFALAKEVIHLLSDVSTKKSLPLPIVSAISPNLSRILGYLDIDYYNIKLLEKEAGLALVVNSIIRLLHGFAYNEDKDGSRDLYNVRTLKIIDLSSEIVTFSSVIECAVRMAMGDEKALRDFDMGGTIVSLWHILNDPYTIAKIKHEYIVSKTEEHIIS